MTEQEYKEKIKELKATRRAQKKLLKKWAEELREQQVPMNDRGQRVQIGYRDKNGKFVKMGDEYDMWLGMQCAECDLIYGQRVTELKKEYKAGEEL